MGVTCERLTHDVILVRHYDGMILAFILYRKGLWMLKVAVLRR